MPLTRMLGALLRIPGQAIVDRIQHDLTAAGFGDLRPAHFSVFQHLPAEGARLTDIADRAQITKQSMGALVTYLEDAGYLERAPDPRDGRAQVITRTERGWKVERVARASLGALEEEWAERLGPERMHQCREFLEDLVDLIEQNHP